MMNNRWLNTFPILIGIVTAAPPGHAAEVRDHARLFSAEARKQAEAKLSRLERATHIPVVIETIDEIPGLDANSSKVERKEAINKLALKRDKQLHDEGLYILISKRNRVISDVLIRKRYETLLPLENRDAVRDAFIKGLGNKENYDSGLERAVDTIERFLAKAEADVPTPVVRHNVGGQHARGGSSTMGTFLLILVGIFGVLLVLRLVGGLFGSNKGRAIRDRWVAWECPALGWGLVRDIMGARDMVAAEAASSRASSAVWAAPLPATGSTTRCPGGMAT